MLAILIIITMIIQETWKLEDAQQSISIYLFTYKYSFVVFYFNQFISPTAKISKNPTTKFSATYMLLRQVEVRR